MAQGGEFAFVVLSLAQSEKCAQPGHAATTDLDCDFVDGADPNFILVDEPVKLFLTLEREKSPEYHEIPNTHHPMILRVLVVLDKLLPVWPTCSICTLLPSTAILIKLILCGITAVKFYYGDATQPEILRAAGIEHAKIFILAIDDIEDSMNVARHIRLNYPALKLLVRAHDRHHVHLLRDLGVTYIWRETYLSSLGMAYQALRDLGINEKMPIKALSCSVIMMNNSWHNSSTFIPMNKKYIETHRNALAELEHLFESDAQNREMPLGVDLKRGLHSSDIDVTRDAAN